MNPEPAEEPNYGRAAMKGIKRAGILKKLMSAGGKKVVAKTAAKTAAKTGAKVAAKGGAKFVPGLGEVLMVIDAAPEAWRVQKEKLASVRDTGQIYIPFVNWGLFVFIVLAVGLFKTSSNLASAYGIAVTIDMTITTTRIAEVGSMQTSFLKMVRQLTDYRNYMPASILAGGEDDEESAPSETASSRVESGIKPGAADKASKSSKASAASRGSQKAVAASMEVKVKKITILVANIRRWHAVSVEQGPVVSASIHTQYIKKVLNVVMGPLKGTPDVFLGDRFLATWNTIKPVATHRTNACHAALQCVKAVKEILLDNSATLDVSCAISSGEVRCGNMGCDGMKKYTFMGAAASLVHIIERQTRKYSTKILVDGAVEEEARNNFVVRKVDHVLVTRVQERPLRLFELVSAKAASDDEWMYQLEAGDHGNPYASYSSAVDLYLQGSHAEGKAALEKCKVKDALFERLTGLLDAAIASNATGTVKLVDIEPG